MLGMNLIWTVGKVYIMKDKNNDDETMSEASGDESDPEMKTVLLQEVEKFENGWGGLYQQLESSSRFF